MTFYYRPFSDLYLGLGSVFAILVGVSVVICIINFCVVYKFCQTFDENTESWVGGFSICDIFTCVLTCGMNRARVDENPDSAQEQDFTYRFRKSLDQAKEKHVKLFSGNKKSKNDGQKSINDYLNRDSKLRANDVEQPSDEG